MHFYVICQCSSAHTISSGSETHKYYHICFWCSFISVFQQRNWVSNMSDVEVLYNKNLISQVLTNHYERCGRYYGSGGWGSHGSATEEERRLTMMLFSGIFDSLAQRVCLIFLMFRTIGITHKKKYIFSLYL